ncbi:nitrous oxide reductase family maturation protein NosD [Brevibacillus choshinensis]|uniref:right-handed parallel beta-helix repeat-containing protein n=1 Tax=Brevibacillus choshinensis TaxID=54911 RepID=UPI002E1EE39E|nr:NosD domain-containing protein [Brevibacillus choshinensis]
MLSGWKNKSVFRLLLLTSTSLFLFYFNPVSTRATGLTAPDPLQQMIDQARPGDTITIPAGEYAGPIRVTKPLVLVAQGSVTIFNPSPDPKQEPVVTIISDHVSIQGISITDKRINRADAALIIKGNHNILEQISIETMGSGIQLREASNNTLHNIRITGKIKDKSVASSMGHDHASHGASTAGQSSSNVQARKGNGIDLFQAHQNRIVSNQVSNVYDGIYLENSNGNQILQNAVEKSRYGYHFMGTSQTLLADNTGNENVTGAMLMETTKATVKNNQFLKQKNNPNSQGILLYDVTDSLLHGNQIEGNRVGLYLENATGVEVKENRLLLNFIGMQVKASSGNTLTANQFVSNVIQAQAQDSSTDSFAGNYWDNLQTLDTNGDSRSDLPYEMNPFYLALTDAVPAYQLFFQAPGFVFLENLFSAGTGTAIRDEMPTLASADEATAQASGTNWVTGILGLILLTGSMYIIYSGGKRQ